MLKQLQLTPAEYNYFGVDSHSFSIAQGSTTFVKEDAFAGEDIRKITLALIRSDNFGGSQTASALHFAKHGLQQVKVSRSGKTLIDIDCTNNAQVFFNTSKSLNYVNDGPQISLSTYSNHYYMVFDLTSVEESFTEVHYPETVGAAIKIELRFLAGTAHALELLAIGEKLTTVSVDKTGRVTKNG